MTTGRVRLGWVWAVALAACGGGSAQDAGQVGGWTGLGAMATGRSSHAAVVLPDGKVLLAGGYGAEPAVGTLVIHASAELYDPVRGVSTPTGSMGTARAQPLAVPLPGGRVLIAGGVGSATYLSSGPPAFTVLSSAEVYDPATGTFQPTGSMVSARGFSGGVALEDGRVLVGAGCDGAGRAVGRAEIYLPDAGVWIAAGVMPTPLTGSMAVVGDGGLVLVVGGFADGGCTTLPRASDQALLYQLSTGTWRSTSRLPVTIGGHTLTTLPGGEALLTGGGVTSSFNAHATTWRFDPAQEQWRPASPMTAARLQSSAVLLASGRVLVAGGSTIGTDARGAPAYTAPAGDVYDPVGDVWAPTPNLPGDVLGFGAMVRLPSGQVLYTGGERYSGGVSVGNGDILSIPAVQRFAE